VRTSLTHEGRAIRNRAARAITGRGGGGAAASRFLEACLKWFEVTADRSAGRGPAEANDARNSAPVEKAKPALESSQLQSTISTATTSELL